MKTHVLNGPNADIRTELSLSKIVISTHTTADADLPKNLLEDLLKS